MQRHRAAHRRRVVFCSRAAVLRKAALHTRPGPRPRATPRPWATRRLFSAPRKGAACRRSRAIPCCRRAARRRRAISRRKAELRHRGARSKAPGHRSRPPCRCAARGLATSYCKAPACTTATPRRPEASLCRSVLRRLAAPWCHSARPRLPARRCTATPHPTRKADGSRARADGKRQSPGASRRLCPCSVRARRVLQAAERRPWAAGGTGRFCRPRRVGSSPMRRPRATGSSALPRPRRRPHLRVPRGPSGCSSRISRRRSFSVSWTCCRPLQVGRASAHSAGLPSAWSGAWPRPCGRKRSSAAWALGTSGPGRWPGRRPPSRPPAGLPCGSSASVATASATPARQPSQRSWAQVRPCGGSRCGTTRSGTSAPRPWPWRSP
mmetsp:Transcript_57711/g.185466  ORF Transcript_57711/g.185466 Transcript_57711/m.185466 type:complete len:381 (-) Transcript_57711:1048-2190(-)